MVPVDAGPTVPSPPVLVFDGDCGFCTASAHWIGRRLTPPAAVMPWQALDLAAFGLSEADVATAAYWVDERGGLHRGASAVAEALRAAGGRWGLVGRALGRPPLSWLAGPVYAVVARNRHRLPGGTPACRLPRS